MVTSRSTRTCRPMAPHRLEPLNPLATAFARLVEVPGYGWAAGFLTSLLAFMGRDPFAGILSLLLASNAIDWYYGRVAARHGQRFEPQRSSAGWHSKMIGLLLLLLIRGFESYAMRHIGMELPSLFAVLPAVALFVSDLESIDHHRTALGARPIPVLSRSIQFLRAWEERKYPPATPEVQR